MCNSAAKQVSAGVPACYITGRTSFGNVVVGKCFVLEKTKPKTWAHKRQLAQRIKRHSVAWFLYQGYMHNNWLFEE